LLTWTEARWAETTAAQELKARIDNVCFIVPSPYAYIESGEG